jgi:hypothetical protein
VESPERYVRPRPSLAAPVPELLEGVADPSVPVADFFEAFDWEGQSLDADTLSAEDFLTSLGD